MNSPLAILFGVVVNFALMVVFLRFMFQLAEINQKHPYGKVAYRLSAVVTVFTRIFPDLAKGRFSTSAVVLMLLLTYIKISGFAGLMGESLTALTLFFGGTLSGILTFVKMLKYILFASVIFSWVIMLTNKMHPAMDVIMQLSEPIVAPFRRIVPTLGMLDFSTLVALLALGLIEIFIEVVGGHILRTLF